MENKTTMDRAIESMASKEFKNDSKGREKAARIFGRAANFKGVEINSSYNTKPTKKHKPKK